MKTPSKFSNFLFLKFSYTARMRFICLLGLLTIGLLLFMIFYVQKPLVKTYELKLIGIQQNRTVNDLLEKCSELELIMNRTFKTHQEYIQAIEPLIARINLSVYESQNIFKKSARGSSLINHEVKEQIQTLLEVLKQQWKEIFDHWSLKQILNTDKLTAFTRQLIGILNYTNEVYGLDLAVELKNYYLQEMATIRLPVVLVFLSEIEAKRLLGETQEAAIAVLAQSTNRELDVFFQEVMGAFAEDAKSTFANELTGLDSYELFQKMVQTYLNEVVNKKDISFPASDILKMGWKLQRGLLDAFEISQQNALKTLYFRQNFSAIVSSILALLFLLIYYTRLIRGPAESLKNAAQSLAKGDLSVRVPITSKDEIADITQAFNLVASLWGNSISQVKKISDRLNASASTIFETAKRLEANIDHQEEVIDTIETKVREIALTGQRFSMVLKSVNKSIGTTSALASQSTISLTYMADIMHQMISASSEIVKTLDVIKGHADRINDIIGAIVEVADQSNLLSLNTAIRANRSGSTGKGFTVVADKIRELADQTAYATLDIEQAVQEIFSVMSNAVTDVNRFAAQIKVHEEDEKNVNNQLKERLKQTQVQIRSFETINEGMQLQLSESTQIAHLITNFSEVTFKTDKTVRKLYRDAEFLYSGTQNLSEVLKVFHVKEQKM